MEKLAFLLVLLISVPSLAIVDKVQLKTKDKYKMIASFGFLEEGTAEVSVTLTPETANAWLLLCSEKQYYSVFSYSAPDPCLAMSNSTCAIARQVINGRLEVNEVIQEYGMYFMIFANCERTLITADISFTLLNPGGEHLGFEYIPLPALYIVLLMLWISATGFWCFNWIKNRNQRIVLHRIISLFPLGKFVWCIVALYFWKTYSNEGTVSMATGFFYRFVMILYRALFYFILLLISSGWGIVTDSLDKENKSFIAFIIGGLIVTQIASFLLLGLFQLLTMIIYVVIIVMIFRSINKNLITLHLESRNNNPEQDNNDRSNNRNTTSDKDKMYRTFKVIMVTYLTMVMVITLVYILFLNNYPWVLEMLQELLELLMFICIGWTFRLRGVNIYYRLSNQDEPVDRSDAVELNNVN